MKLDDGIKHFESAIIRFLMETDGDQREHLVRAADQPSSRRLSETHWAERLADRWTPDVLELWQTFNSKRSGALASYFTSADSSRAYIAGFMLPNVLRLTSIFRGSKHFQSVFSQAHLDKLSDNKPMTLEMIDYGAGPLTATVATALAWIASEHRSSRPGGAVSGRQLASVVVERSDRAWRDGNLLLELMRPWFAKHDLTVSIRRLRAEAVRAGLSNTTKPPSWARDGLKIFVAANVLNELSSEDKRTMYKVILGSLEHGARALVLEPGQDVHSKRLGGFRDKLLAEQKQWAALEPCTHRSPCPLGPSSDRADWCWFRVTQKWPQLSLLRSFDQRTGLRHTDLNYSYVIFGPRPLTGESHDNWGRVVSDPIPQSTPDRSAQVRQFRYISTNALSPLSPAARQRLGQGRSIKSLVCHNSGRLVGVVPAPGEPQLQRGQHLAQEPQCDAIFAERAGKKKK